MYGSEITFLFVDILSTTPTGLHGNPCRPYPFLIDHLEQGLCNLVAMLFEVELYGRESRRGYVAHELVVVDTKEGNVIRNPDSL